MNRKQPHTDQLTGRCILVPLEPTKDMLLAGSADLRMGDCIGTLVRAAECWRAMVAAAPQPEGHTCTCPSGDGSLRWPCPQHPASARLTKPAKVGNGTFCAGVHESRVIEAAQRQYEIFTTEPKASHEERMAQERARRNLWDMLHGPLPTSSNDPALPTRPQVADTLLAEVASNFTRDDDLPNDLLGRIDAYLTSEGYTE